MLKTTKRDFSRTFHRSSPFEDLSRRPTGRSRQFAEDNLRDNHLQEISQGRLQGENENPSHALRGDVSRTVANGVLSFDGEEQGTEEVVHVFHTHFSLDELRSVGEIVQREKKLVVVDQDEVAVFDGDEKVEKGEDEPTDQEAEEDETQD